jgi:hypothetical protein
VPDQLPVLGHAGQHLAARDRGVEWRRQRGVALGVVGVERLLDPDQVEFVDRAAVADQGTTPRAM